MANSNLPAPVAKIGISAIKSATKDTARVLSSLYGAFGDLRVTLSDYQYIKPLLGGIYGLKGASAAELRAELADLDDSESEEVAACFKAEFKLDGSLSVEEAIEIGFELLVETLPMIYRLFSHGQRIHTASLQKVAAVG